MEKRAGVHAFPHRIFGVTRGQGRRYGTCNTNNRENKDDWSGRKKLTISAVLPPLCPGGKPDGVVVGLGVWSADVLMDVTGTKWLKIFLE